MEAGGDVAQAKVFARVPIPSMVTSTEVIDLIEPAPSDVPHAMRHSLEGGDHLLLGRMVLIEDRKPGNILIQAGRSDQEGCDAATEVYVRPYPGPEPVNPSPHPSILGHA